jgi:hypothetical protein
MKQMVCHFAAAWLLMASVVAAGPYDRWEHSGSFYILTTHDGAYLPESASVPEFPLLLRLDKGFFDFQNARPRGEDLRFATPDGTPLAYQIEQWDPIQGVASIWVRIQKIRGNELQEVRIYWGNSNAGSESSGSAVFNASNGYLSVWHMGGPVNDEVGTLPSKDAGTTATNGVIGQCRHLAGGQGIFCGDKIANYPSGASPHSSEAWIRPERPNTTILGWGNEGGGRGTKIRMQLRSPPHIHIDSDFADVNGEGAVPMGKWTHVVHTYDGHAGKIYIDGTLDGYASPKLNIQNPCRFWIGGWYGHYDFVGDIDEVRISSVARSPEWVKLEYENQKALQTLVGPVVDPSKKTDLALWIWPSKPTIEEGRQIPFSAVAPGAVKNYWILKSKGQQTLIAVDRFGIVFEAGRVPEDETVTLELRAIFPNAIRAVEVPIKIEKKIPDPIFSLSVPLTWDGRSTLEIVPKIANLDKMKAAGAGDVHYHWKVGDFAVTRQIEPGKLILHRAQNSGTLTITATLDNGGTPVSQSAQVVVAEPRSDPWIARPMPTEEIPEEGQFYARDGSGDGALYCVGILANQADSVFVRVTADDRPYAQQSQAAQSGKRYAMTVRLRPGLVRYKAVFGSRFGGRETILNTADHLLCGDAYLIDGQSNAEATSWGKEDYAFTSPWIVTYGSMNGGEREAHLRQWGSAVARGPGGKLQVGYWGMELARRLVENQKVPIFIINGAVGGTRIDVHQRNDADEEDVNTIYGRLLWRVRQAKLTHGIRAILWHQGENDQAADGPTGGFGYETYRSYFLDMAAGWKHDYPNVGHYYVFQIWPKSCSMGINGSDNRLREVQRTLSSAFSNLSVMSTLGIEPPGSCHFPPAGYAEFARLICPLVERDNYGKLFAISITAPNLGRAHFTGDKRTEIVLEFDQPIVWDNSLCGQFYIDGQKGAIESGSASGNKLTLKLENASTAKTISYLDSKAWSQKTLLRGQNGIAALTFCEVPIAEQ